MKTRLLAVIAVGVFIYSCSSEETQTKFETKADQKNELAVLQAQALQNLKQKFVFEAGSGRELEEWTSEGGVRFSIDPNKLTIKGQPVKGSVVVEFIEIYRRGDMLTANKTTSGLANGQEQNPEQPALNPLVTGGEFFVDITTAESGEDVDDGVEYTLIVSSGQTGGPDDDMTLWTGEEDLDGDTSDGGDGEGDVKWDEDQNDDGSDKDAPLNGSKYILTLDKFGWCNIDKLAEWPNPKTTIYVDVPNGYDDTNSKIYIAFEGFQNTLIQLNTYDGVTGYFGENYNLMPIGENCHVIFVSGSAGNWLYAIQTATITPFGIITINAGDIQPATQNDVINMLNSLP